MPSGGQRGLEGVLAVVDPGILLETVEHARAQHELPDAQGPLARKGKRVKGALPGGQIDQVLRHSLLLEGFENHRPVDSSPLDDGLNVMPRVVLQISDDTVHIVV